MQFLNVTDHIRDPNIDLPTMCKHIDEQKHHVSQTLSEEMSVTFNELINRKRIAIAQQILADPQNANLKIFAVALESGFTHKSTFHRVFVKYTHSTPHQFRQQKQS